MTLAATLLAALALGFAIVSRVWRDDAASPRYAERALYALAVGSLLWIASDWLLALLHWLEGPLLVVRTVAFAVAAVVFWPKRRVALPVSASAIALAPLAAWIAFAVWRGAVTPPASIDALSYHLPKAVHYVRAGGYDTLRGVRFLISWRPSNYELLLADAMAMAGRDDVTEWISVFFYCAFVVAAVALGQRWHGWNAGAATLTALLAGSLPVVMLHAADYKNDVMTAFFMAAAVVVMGRWITERDPRALVLTLLLLGACAGTKTPAAIFAVLAVPFLIRRSSLPARRLVPLLAVTFAAMLLVGAISHLEKLTEPAPVTRAPSSRTDGLSYGHYANLLKGPYLLLSQSFSPDPHELKVPWSAPWMWQRYELYYSELGVAFTAFALALPLVILKSRRTPEQLAATILTFAAFAAILPFDGVPRGRYLIGLPRFAIAVAPVVFAWSVGPLMAALRARGRAIALLIAALLFTWYGYLNAKYDTFAPLDFVIAASRQPGRRLPPIGYQRAAAVLDEMAPPTSRVAFDGGISALLHPAYGATLQRRVDIIPPGDGKPSIAADVEWVVIDRAWNLIWGDPTLNDMTQPRKIGRGLPSEEDLRVFRAMRADPRFALVFFNPRGLQAVFRRR